MPGVPSDTIWFPSIDDVRQIHADVLDLMGTVSPGVDLGKLEGAINRPLWRMRYEGETDIVVIGDALASALANAHAFVDGNKRTAYATLMLFLTVNGSEPAFAPGDIAIAEWIERIVIVAHESRAAAERAENEFAEYLRLLVDSV